MSERSSLISRPDEPLIGIPDEVDGEEVIRYFASEADADAAMLDEDVQMALNSIGAVADLDFDEMIRALDRIRHESQPTPPLTDI